MSAWFLESELSTCYGSHSFPCRSLLLSTTVQALIGEHNYRTHSIIIECCIQDTYVY